MASVEHIIRDSISSACGPEGLKKFSAAGYDRLSFVDVAGEPDLESLTTALLEVFAPEKASAIAGDFGKRLRSEPVDNDSNDGDALFSHHSQAQPDDVRGMVAEARQIRKAMGKEMVDYRYNATLKTDMTDSLEGEIYGFVYGRNIHTSIDIMDFIGYLKGKGYNVQESILLTKLYEKIEQRKKEEKYALEQVIRGFLKQNPSMSESEVAGFVRQMAANWHICDRDEIERMIRDALLRR
ncbi:MAG TPA: hypothetical protein VK436_15485 [Methanocella sp.]|nr:hypothetical protein [Methanocella sp.]